MGTRSAVPRLPAHLRNPRRGRRRGDAIAAEWMGHSDYQTTLIYADYPPSGREADLVDAAFGGGGADQVLETHLAQFGVPA